MPLSDLLLQCLKNRKKYLSENKIEAYRLLHLGESEWPFAIDIYRDNTVIHIFQKIERKTAEEMEKIIRKMLNIEKFFWKNRTKESIEFLDARVAAQKKSQTMTVQEYGHTFSLNLSDYLDTGLFLDHRETRRWIQIHSKNKKILNTFAYTGSFSVYAAAGFAGKTVSVDLSKTYCDWIKENLALNHLPPEKNWVYKMDTFEFFKYAKKKNLTFDIIIIDPPTFSKNKGRHFSVQEDHPELINQALEILTPEGFILFSNNCKTFSFNFRKITSSRVTEKKDTIPLDFPGLKPHHCFIIAKK